jgi:hypothetical protein
VHTIGAFEAEDAYTFGAIADIAISETDEIHVLDARFARIQVYTSGGQYVRSIGRSGMGPGEFVAPSRMGLLGEEEIVVRDYGKGRHLILSSGGEAITSVASEPEAERLREQIASDTLGRFYESRRAYNSTSVADVLLRFTRLGREFRIDSIPLPKYRRPLIVIDNETFAFQDFVPLTPRFFWSVMPDGQLAYAIGDEYRVVIRGGAGKGVKAIERLGVPVKIHNYEQQPEYVTLRRRLEGASQGLADGGRAVLADGYRQIEDEQPEYYPAIMGLAADRCGRIWVRRPVESNGAVVMFDVYNGEGGELGSVSLQQERGIDWNVLAVGKKQIVVRGELEYGVNVVHVYEVGAVWSGQ